MTALRSNEMNLLEKKINLFDILLNALREKICG